MTQRFVLVTTDGRRRLVPLDRVSEILAMMALEEVEGGARSCRGLANLRGEIIPVFDASGSDARLAPSRLILVSQAGSEPMGVIVDEVHDVLELSRDRLATRTLGEGRRLTVARLEEELVPVLEPAELAQGRG